MIRELINPEASENIWKRRSPIATKIEFQVIFKGENGSHFEFKISFVISLF